MSRAATPQMEKLNPASAKNGICQPRCAARKTPIGTPKTNPAATEDITNPIADPRRSSGITSATIANFNAPS